jgi:hypothetical protein
MTPSLHCPSQYSNAYATSSLKSCAKISMGCTLNSLMRLSDEAIQEQFNEFREREWMSMQRECDDAWADFLYRHVPQR